MATPTLSDLQCQLKAWVDNWILKGEHLESHPIDLPDIVHILRALGFKVWRMDGSHPDNRLPLENKKKGIRVTVTCNYSGTRCYLEQPLNEESCKCMKIPIGDPDDVEAAWETRKPTPSSEPGTPTPPVGVEIIPLLSNELNNIIYSVVNYLVHMINGYVQPVSEFSPTEESLTSTSERVEQRGDKTFTPIFTQPTAGRAALSEFDITKHSTLIGWSPPPTDDRFKSVDELTAKNAVPLLPEPRMLGAHYSDYRTTSNISTKLDLVIKEQTVKLSASNDAIVAILKAGTYLEYAIRLLRSDEPEPGPKKDTSSKTTKNSKSLNIPAQNQPSIGRRTASTSALSKTSTSDVKSSVLTKTGTKPKKFPSSSSISGDKKPKDPEKTSTEPKQKLFGSKLAASSLKKK